MKTVLKKFVPCLGNGKSPSSSKIEDKFETLAQVNEALRNAGLQSSKLIIAVDFTKSNEWTGMNSFGGRNLHDVDLPTLNPYEQVISIIGQTLLGFDEDDLIHCYGFGDMTTHDDAVFSFLPGDKPCHGFEQVLRVYRDITPHVKLSGPTSFSPIIETAIDIVEKSGGRYHVLLIIADGLVTRSIDTPRGELSVQESKTLKAIEKASQYPLSIICIGVGDGPWDTMRRSDDRIMHCAFDNFQFVEFKTIFQGGSRERKEASFAAEALMEIPDQYKAILCLNLLGQTRGVLVGKEPLPPPNS